MATARKARNLENPLSDSDSERNVDTAPSQVRPEVGLAAVEHTLGKFTVTALNSNRKLTLKLDEVAVAFIAGWIVPLIRMCATLQAPHPKDIGSQHSSQ